MTRRSTTTKTPSSQRFLRLGLWRSLQLVLLLVVVMRNPKDPAGVEAWCSASRSRSRNPIRIPLRQQQRRQHWQRSAPTTSQPRSTILNARSNEYEDDEDDEDDEEPPEVGDVQTFLQQHQQRQPSSSSTTAVFGLNRGRSSPSHRQAVGKSGVARVYLCTNCGSESIQWLGRCPTCQEWNTLQEHAVVRRTTKNPTAAAAMRPLFGSSASSSSWLDHLVPYHSSGAADPEQNMFLGDGAPVRVTDLIQQNNNNNSTKSNRRIVIPEDPEFNRVLGGGIVPGSLILVGGDPGVGKSTLLLQAAGQIAASTAQSRRPGIGMGLPNSHDNNATATEPAVVVWYVSGEETPAQVADRAQRLGLAHAEDLYLLRETHVDTLCAQIVAAQQQQQQQQQYNSRRNSERELEDDDDDASFQQQQQRMIRPPSLIILDSIQTLHCDSAQHAAPGGVTQVRECVALLLRLAKSTHTAVWLVGHVTKTGDVAGPRTVEHMVDAVLYLEHAGLSSGGSSEGGLRILRASKNRFGPADDNVGVYEIVSGSGRLRPVSDPSALFMAQRQQHSNEDVEGSAVAIVLEGRRAVAVEVQALVTWAAANAGRRTVHGLTTSRLLLLLGVLQKRCGMIGFGRQDVYVNVVGSTSTMTSTQQQQQQHAADLAVAVALASSLHQIAVRSDTAFVGQVGLLGELRTVPRLEQRLQEAQRMGFSRVVTPRDVAGNSKNRKTKTSSSKIHISRTHGMDWIQCDTLQVAINEGLVNVIPNHKRKRRAGTTQNQSEDSDLWEIMDDQDDADDDPIESGFG